MTLRKLPSIIFWLPLAHTHICPYTCQHTYTHTHHPYKRKGGKEERQKNPITIAKPRGSQEKNERHSKEMPVQEPLLPQSLARLMSIWTYNGDLAKIAYTQKFHQAEESRICVNHVLHLTILCELLRSIWAFPEWSQPRICQRQEDIERVKGKKILFLESPSDYLSVYNCKIQLMKQILNTKFLSQILLQSMPKQEETNTLFPPLFLS